MAATVVAAGCTGPTPREPAASLPPGQPIGSEPPNSAPAAPAPPVGFTASVTREGEALRISYRLVNDDDRVLAVLNQVPAERDPSFTSAAPPDSVYVTGRGDHTVEIAKRAFDMPPGMVYDVPQVVGATLLAPGESVAEEFAVPLPLRRRHPYGDDGAAGPIPLPDPIDAVVFCVGVVTEPPASPPDTVTLPHMFGTTLRQHLFCSPPTALG